MGWIERLRPRGFEAVLTVESVATPDTQRNEEEDLDEAVV